MASEVDDDNNDVLLSHSPDSHTADSHCTEEENSVKQEPNPFSFYTFIKSSEVQKQTNDQDQQLTLRSVESSDDDSILWYKIRLKELESRVEHLTLENKQLKRERKLREEKDAKDVAALERLVQTVEEKLRINQKRCTQAEERCSKQAAEIKKLKQANKQLCVDASVELSDASPHTYSSYTRRLREQSVSVSQQLTAAATHADTHIRSLMSGVEHLHLLSQILSSAASNLTYEMEPTGD